MRTAALLRLGVRGANLLGRPLRGTRLLDLSAERLMESAQERTGLEDFGDELFREPLGLLTHALDREARLTPFGRLLARQQLIGLLANRLRMEADWKEDPGIQEQEVPAPLVIIGLPRTGTTALQHLLGADPRNRSLLHWQVLAPSPPPRHDESDADPRIGQAERGFKLVYALAPEGRTIHPQEAQLPTECVGLFNHSFASLELAATYRVPSYLGWLLSADLAPHYAYFKRQLQLLQRHANGRRWVLKSPAHLFFLDALLATFPDARIVHLHRDPLEALPSYCSLVAVLRRLTSDRVDPVEIGRRWPALWAQAVERTMRERDHSDPDRFIDVALDDLVADPVACAERIYRRFGQPLPDGTAERMRRFAAEHPRHRHGVHRYSLGQFGISAEEQRHRFARYVERYRVATAGS